MSLVESNPNQTMFFNVDCINDPYSFELYRLINDVVDKVDVGEVNSRYDSVYGRKAYDRSILLKCVLKAYCSKAYSSREIERHINNDMTCYLLAEGNSPNHVTIANFLNEGSELIRKAFETLNEMAIEEEFATVLIAIDGTKIKADASMSNVITMDGLDLIDELEEYFEYFSDYTWIRKKDIT